MEKLKKIHALVLDDDPCDAKTIVARLEDLGITVTSAEEPRDDVGGPFHVAFVDMVFYGHPRGPDFCAAIKRRWPLCLVVAISCVGDRDEIFDHAISAGACFPLAKENMTRGMIRQLVSLRYSNCFLSEEAVDDRSE